MSENHPDVKGNSPCQASLSPQQVQCRAADRRVRHLFILCGLFIFIGTFMLLRPALLGREAVIAESKRLSLRRGVMPAVRGRILGDDGTVIAWSERKFDLYCTETGHEKRRESIMAAAAVVSGIVDRGAEKPLRRELTPAEYAAVRGALGSIPSLRMVSRNIRKYHGAWQEAAGEVMPDEDGLWVGVSGWEAEFEEVLSGVPGRFEVNVDPGGNWIRDTFKITLAPVQGEDVTVHLRPEEPSPEF